jgi:putative transposase
LIGLSQARYRDWIRNDRCGLDDRPSCPRSSPQQLTATEINTIRDMVTSDEMYFGTGSAIPMQLEASRIAARQSRMDANRAQTCQTCAEEVSISG